MLFDPNGQHQPITIGDLHPASGPPLAPELLASGAATYNHRPVPKYQQSTQARLFIVDCLHSHSQETTNLAKVSTVSRCPAKQ
jgi:hypothetical protein